MARSGVAKATVDAGKRCRKLSRTSATQETNPIDTGLYCARPDQYLFSDAIIPPKPANYSVFKSSFERKSRVDQKEEGSVFFRYAHTAPYIILAQARYPSLIYQ